MSMSAHLRWISWSLATSTSARRGTAHRAGKPRSRLGGLPPPALWRTHDFACLEVLPEIASRLGLLTTLLPSLRQQSDMRQQELANNARATCGLGVPVTELLE
jgi:hypothetical protein